MQGRVWAGVWYCCGVGPCWQTRGGQTAMGWWWVPVAVMVVGLFQHLIFHVTKFMAEVVPGLQPQHQFGSSREWCGLKANKQRNSCTQHQLLGRKYSKFHVSAFLWCCQVQAAALRHYGLWAWCCSGQVSTLLPPHFLVPTPPRNVTAVQCCMRCHTHWSSASYSKSLKQCWQCKWESKKLQTSQGFAGFPWEAQLCGRAPTKSPPQGAQCWPFCPPGLSEFARLVPQHYLELTKFHRLSATLRASQADSWGVCASWLSSFLFQPPSQR